MSEAKAPPLGQLCHIIAAALGALFLASCATAKPAPTAVAKPADLVEIYNVPAGDSPVRGRPDAKVTVVEFSDYQCPYCLRAQPVLQELAAGYGDELRFVFKNNPLPFHPHAMPAALAALAAGRQGKFWEMHDRLFANQRVQHGQEGPAIEQLAVELGLDLAQFKNDLADPALKQSIEGEQALANQLGAAGTPSFFINGAMVVGAQPVAIFKVAIEAARARAEEKLAQGVSRSELYAALIAGGRTERAPPAAGAAREEKAQVRKIAIDAEAPRRGAQNAKVVIVEFGDFQCPFCGRSEPTLNRILLNHPNEVALIWKNQPLPFHPRAMSAAKAAMAAHQQGRFWEMHDRMLNRQQELGDERYEAWASDLGLDLARWRQDQLSPKIELEIAADQAEGASSGASGTPTFFLNGKMLVGAVGSEAFEKIIDEQLAKANQLLQAGTSQAGLYDALVEANLKEAGAN